MIGWHRGSEIGSRVKGQLIVMHKKMNLGARGIREQETRVAKCPILQYYRGYPYSWIEPVVYLGFPEA